MKIKKSRISNLPKKEKKKKKTFRYNLFMNKKSIILIKIIFKNNKGNIRISLFI